MPVLRLSLIINYNKINFLEIPQDTNKSLHLPPIHIEGHVMVDVETDKKNENIPSESNSGPISVKRKIRELKINRKTTFGWMPGKYNNS